MRKIVVFSILISAILCVLTSAKKEDKNATEKAAATQHTSAYREDQIARKKAILTFKMVFVEGGSFTMGCTAEQESECLLPEKPAHPVFVRSFAICKYTVTQRQWREVMGKNPSDTRDDDSPVTNISWDDAQKFIEKLQDFDVDAFTKRLTELIMNPEELQKAAEVAISLGHPDVAGQMVRLIEQGVFQK